MRTAKATPPIRTGVRQRVGQATKMSAAASPVAAMAWPLGYAYIEACARSVGGGWRLTISLRSVLRSCAVTRLRTT